LYLSYPCFPGLLQLSCPGITSHVGDSRGQLPGGTSFRQDVLWDAWQLYYILIWKDAL
jgi:acyl-CoA-binding protein